MSEKTSTGAGRLRGKVCIVTGAGTLRGIGWTTILRFADEGIRHVYAVDLNPTNFGVLRETFEEMYPASNITFVQGDATNENVIKSLCDRALEETGRLDIFFANAGTFGSQSPSYDQTPLADFVECLRVNVGSAFLALKYASSAIAKTNEASGKLDAGGSIILMGSNSGLRANSTPVEYGASKAAVHHLAMSGAYHNNNRGTGVRVNAVFPGPAGTDFLPAPFQAYVAKRPDLFCSPSAIANTVLFMASDESAFINGTTITLDNGVTNGYFLESLLD
ncbi:SDR family oxidoreductase [Phanerochaete sordida]|uniref:SDR family oxidoreductase n=1 Tax=Phanerochaete sordida TaxID=48140 RepID=A0A9P3GL79_9APHY|nr:SDR family oxidoreductase [Phanerochaete sordida]